MCDHSGKVSAWPTVAPLAFNLNLRHKSRLPMSFLILFYCLTLTLAEIYKVPLKMSSDLVNDAVLANRRMSRQTNTQTSAQEQEDNLEGKPGQGYYMEMQIGNPPQMLNVLVDTGSSNFAVASAPHQDITNYFDSSKSTTFHDLGKEVYVPYTQGNWRGHLGQDDVRMTSLPNITVNTDIACISSSEKFFINGSHWQGILGLAFSEIARPDSSVKPYFDSLVEQTDVADIFSMQLCGTIDRNTETDVEMGGTMIVGGIDPSLYIDDMLYAVLRRQWYYEVIITDVAVAGRSISMDCKEYNFDKTIVDSGTTNLRLPNSVFTKVTEAIKDFTENSHFLHEEPPTEFWTGVDMLCWPEGNTPWFAFPNITIGLAESHNTSISLVISPQQYLRAVSDSYDADTQNDCYKYAVAPSDTGTVLGAVVMEGFYVVFDRSGNRIGFARSTCVNRDPTAEASHVRGPYNVKGATSDCAYVKPPNKQSTLVTVAYVTAGICGACLLPLIFLVIQWFYQRWRQRKLEQTDSSTDIGDIGSLLKDDDDQS